MLVRRRSRPPPCDGHRAASGDQADGRVQRSTTEVDSSLGGVTEIGGPGRWCSAVAGAYAFKA